MSDEKNRPQRIEDSLYGKTVKGISGYDGLDEGTGLQSYVGEWRIVFTDGATLEIKADRCLTRVEFPPLPTP